LIWTSKTLPPSREAEIRQPHVGLRAAAVGDDAPVLIRPISAWTSGMIDAHDGEAVERHVLDERRKASRRPRRSAVVVEMLGIDVGDHHDFRRQLDEGAVGLVRLHHHPVAAPSRALVP
jgi:hypothetical protein